MGVDAIDDGLGAERRAEQTARLARRAGADADRHRDDVVGRHDDGGPRRQPQRRCGRRTESADGAASDLGQERLGPLKLEELEQLLRVLASAQVEERGGGVGFVDGELAGEAREDPAAARQRSVRALDGLGFLLAEPAQDGGGKAGEGDRSVDAKRPLESAVALPALDELAVAPVVPEHRGAHRLAGGVNEPAAVALGSERDEVDRAGRLVAHGAQRRGHRAPHLMHVLLGEPRRRVKDARWAPRDRALAPRAVERDRLDDRGPDVDAQRQHGFADTNAWAIAPAT